MKDFQTEQLLFWSGMTYREDTKSGSNEEVKFNAACQTMQNLASNPWLVKFTTPAIRDIKIYRILVRYQNLLNSSTTLAYTYGTNLAFTTKLATNERGWLIIF